MGAGDSYDDMIALSKQLGVDDIVDSLAAFLTSSSNAVSRPPTCLSPDPRNPLNDISTMNKVLEYMAMARPIVSL